VIPLAAWILVVARVRRGSSSVRAFVAASAPTAFFFTIVVATFATRFADDRIHERNLFQLAPLLFVGLVVWITQHDLNGLGSWPLAALAAAAAALLPLTIPYTRFIGEPAKGDTLALIPVWTINEYFLAGSVLLTVGLVCGALGAVFVLVPKGWAVALFGVVLAWFALLQQPVFGGPRGFRVSSEGAVFQGIRGVDRDWIDHAVRAGSTVAAVYSGLSARFTINQNEFFNRRLGRIFYLDEPTPGGLPETHITFGPNGLAHTDDGHVVQAGYLLADGFLTPYGVPVARDEQLGLTVWRLIGPLLQTTTIRGVDPDRWSGRHVTWVRRRCRGGELRVELTSDPSLFRRPNFVVAESNGRRVSKPVAVRAATTVRVPLSPSARTCVVRFTFTRTLVPARVTHGRNPDPRHLAARFVGFEYRAAR
jgi:hypothetical protein